MTVRPFLFLSGEFQVTMPLVFSREKWQHTMTARRLVDNEDGTVRRDNVPGERLCGIIYYASVESDAIARANLELLARLDFPCWPDPKRLLELADRHEVMRMCGQAKLTTGPVMILRHDQREHLARLGRPLVLKTGNLHQGHGKHRLGAGDAIPEWEGLATAEPFYEGVSCRVLCMSGWLEGGKRAVRMWGIRYDNPDSWIKNSAGAEVTPWNDLPADVFQHAHGVHTHFGLDVSGIDYVIGNDAAGAARAHFLEFNQFPGVGVDDVIAAEARLLFGSKMTAVEKMAEARALLQPETP